MDSDQRRETDDAAKSPELARKINVLLPSIKHKALIVAQIANLGCPHRHVAAIGADVVRDSGLAFALFGLAKQCKDFLKTVSRGPRSVGDHMAHDDGPIRIFLERLFK